jgi:hypothetical protein
LGELEIDLLESLIKSPLERIDASYGNRIRGRQWNLSRVRDERIVTT